MKSLKKVFIVLLTIVVVLTAIFLAGRYGWKLGGFRACQGAGITSVEVSETAVHITGFYPGSFPEGFCGYYAEDRDGKLYVVFQFSAVFGFFETGGFDITIPVRGEITEVILKTSMNETSLWCAQTGFLPQSEQYGVYVKLERNDVYSLSMSCEGFDGGMNNAEPTAIESGEYIFMDNDIMIVSKEAGIPVPFILIAKDADGRIVASGEFSFDATAEKMYLTVTADGRIVEDKDDEG